MPFGEFNLTKGNCKVLCVTVNNPLTVQRNMPTAMQEFIIRTQ